jgi:hypothetical protein
MLFLFSFYCAVENENSTNKNSRNTSFNTKYLFVLPLTATIATPCILCFTAPKTHLEKQNTQTITYDNKETITKNPKIKLYITCPQGESEKILNDLSLEAKKKFEITIKEIPSKMDNKPKTAKKTDNEPKITRRIVLNDNEIPLVFYNFSSFFELLRLLREYFANPENFKEYQTTKNLLNRLREKNDNSLIVNTLSKIFEMSANQIEAELSKITKKV